MRQRRCCSAQTDSPKAPWVKSSSAARLQVVGVRGRRRSRASPSRPPASASAGCSAGQLDQVVVGARAAHDRVEVADRRHRVGGGGAQRGRGTGAARVATGFEASTSGSRSSSAARRLTKVVFGVAHEVRELRDRLGEALLAVADRVHHPVRGSRPGPRCRGRARPARRRAARCRRSGSRTRRWSELSSPNTRREVERNGFRYWRPRLACGPTPVVGGRRSPGSRA